jgi:iron(III) transport system ATP-binding protein
MIPVTIHRLTKRFERVIALDRVDLRVEPGELFFLLGPSGCGKTTLLRSLAGFCMPDEGEIWFGEENVTRVPPHRRQTGMMFQSYALWPHLSVSENVAFGPEEQKLPRPEIRRRVAEALAAIKMEACADRKINELSGGQQQRVALARALVARPRCLLLDEPLSNLDAKLRLEMRAEIRRVCKESGLTAIYVTHDQKEALSVADRIAILDSGRIRQVGPPSEIYRRPNSAFTADFIGETNFIGGTVSEMAGGSAVVATALGNFRGVAGDPSLEPGRPALLSIRPECWKLQAAATPENSVRGRVADTLYLGEMAQHRFVCGEATLKILELNPRFSAAEAAAGRALCAAVEADDVVVLSG